MTFAGSVSLACAEVNIAIIDSGATRHVDQAISFTSIPGDEDLLNHGTVVAELIRENNPDAKIYMLQVCEMIDGELRPSQDAVEQALKWSIENNMDVINMSMAIRHNDVLDSLIDEAAVTHGIAIIASAGNKGIEDHFAVNEDGFIVQNKSSYEPQFPSSNPHVIAVGAMDHRGKIMDYSSKACDVYASGKVFGQKGTSFASARITAKVGEFLRQNPDASKEEIIAALN